jgi:hypothetical protein
VQAHLLDHCPDVGLRVAEPKRPALAAQPLSQDGEVKHERRIPEDKLAKIDGDVAARIDRLGKSASPIGLRRPVLVASTTQHRGVVIELDDRGNLHNPASRGKAGKRPVQDH